MTSPTLGLVTTDLLAQDVFDVSGDLIPDLLVIDRAAANLAAANLLTNPRLTIWQRQDRLGQTAWSANGDISADRWTNSIMTSAIAVSRLAPGHDAGSPYALRAAYTHVGGGHASVEQVVEAWPQMVGRTVTLRVRVQCAVAGRVRCLLNDGIAPVASAYHGGTGLETLACTLTVAAGATTLKASLLYFDVGTVSADAENASLVYGAVPLPAVPLDPDDVLARCERFLEVHGGAAGHPYVRGYSAVGAGDIAAVTIPFRTQKGGTPTVTKAGAWSVNNAGQPTVPNVNGGGYVLQIASLAAGYFDASPNSADDLIYAEWNPA